MTLKQKVLEICPGYVMLTVTDEYGNLPNWVKLLIKKVRNGSLPKDRELLRRLKFSHDEWCAIYQGGLCRCDVEIGVHHKPITKEMMLESLRTGMVE